MDISLFKPEFAFGCCYVQEYERIIRGEGSSATDFVTDVTDVRKKEEGRRKKEEGEKDVIIGRVLGINNVLSRASTAQRVAYP
ncbi:hypothetical protein QUA83_22965 [Microcoleus sp. K1-B1]|uniref:hypothetical protein n=1 Tax=Microcoleus sp. K1-B6 TaxID=2818787 RepID=UPI002FD7EB27